MAWAVADRLRFGIVFLDDAGFIDIVRRVQFIENPSAAGNPRRSVSGPEHACERSRTGQAQHAGKE